MSSHCLSALLLLSLSVGHAYAAAPLRICADPDNLPFSNRAGAGFDNRIAVLIARDLHRKPVFVWTRTGPGFVREVFNKNACDILMGIPSQVDPISTTVPYYRSTYVFVTPAERRLHLTTFSDPYLMNRRIGVQRLQQDYSPASIPFVRSGRATQLVGFPAFGDGAGDIVRAVADGRVAASVVWGPVAGYFTAHHHLKLTIAPVPPFADVPLAYAISIGLHKGDSTLQRTLSESIQRLQPQIRRVLSADHLPTLNAGGGT
jgi:mxaJ protein